MTSVPHYRAKAAGQPQESSQSSAVEQQHAGAAQGAAMGSSSEAREKRIRMRPFGLFSPNSQWVVSPVKALRDIPQELRLRLVLRTALLGVVLLLLQGMLGVGLVQPGVAPWGIFSLQIPSGRGNAVKILSTWNDLGSISTARTSLLLDFPFVIAYTVLLLLLATGRSSALAPFGLSGVLLFAPALAGLCDMVENAALLGLLLSGCWEARCLGWLPIVASVATTMKFLLLGTTVGFLIWASWVRSIPRPPQGVDVMVDESTSKHEGGGDEGPEKYDHEE